MKKCSIDDCDTTARVVGLCRRHYNIDRYGICRVDGCMQPAGGNDGLCHSHRDKGQCSIDDCDTKATTAGLCQRHYKIGRYGICRADGCERPADGKDGMCTIHRDNGPCEEEGCANGGFSRVDGRLLCTKHRNHAKGVNSPAEHDNSNDPHGLYVWRFLSGVPVYVGISSRADVERRNWEHRNRVDRHTGERQSPWADHVWAPESYSFVYPTKGEAMEAEAVAIHLATRTFGPLANNQHSPGSGRGLELDEVVAKAAQDHPVPLALGLDLGDIECLAIDWSLDQAVISAYGGERR